MKKQAAILTGMNLPFPGDMVTRLEFSVATDKGDPSVDEEVSLDFLTLRFEGGTSVSAHLREGPFPVSLLREAGHFEKALRTFNGGVRASWAYVVVLNGDKSDEKAEDAWRRVKDFVEKKELQEAWGLSED